MGRSNIKETDPVHGKSPGKIVITMRNVHGRNVKGDFGGKACG